MFLRALAVLLLGLPLGGLHAACPDEALNPSCTREATVGTRSIMVDPISLHKGEGLRPVLQRDPLALDLLDQYQQGQRQISQVAWLATPGVILSLWRLTQSDDLATDGLFWTGIGIIGASYFGGKWMSHKNERVLNRAITQYNDSAEKEGWEPIVIKED